MGVKWEGLDKLQAYLESMASMEPIKKVVAHQEKPLIEELSKNAVRSSEGGVFAGGYSGIEQSIGGIKNSAVCELKDGGLTIQLGVTAKYAEYVEVGTTKMPAEPFMQPTAEVCGNRFLDELGRLFK